MTITETTAASAFDWTTGGGSVAAYESLTGTIGFGGKTLDLGSVDYSSATTATHGAGRTEHRRAVGVRSGLRDPVRGYGLRHHVHGSRRGGRRLHRRPAVSPCPPRPGHIAKATPTFTASSGATSAIDLLDTAIKTVSTSGADLGAIQNRFDHTINNLNVAVENLTASESRIRDADMAQEMVQFTRNQILSQAGTAMLAQANQASQGVLSLLR